MWQREDHSHRQANDCNTFFYKYQNLFLQTDVPVYGIFFARSTHKVMKVMKSVLELGNQLISIRQLFNLRTGRYGVKQFKTALLHTRQLS